MKDLKDCDFREYLEILEKNGLLLRVQKEIDVKYEIAAGIRKISDHNGPALLFENVKDYPGWRVAGGIFATPRLMAFALQCPEKDDELLKRYLGFDQKRVSPVMVSTGPVKEIILQGESVDLRRLPLPTYCEYDAGPYLTAGVEIARHPRTGIQNASIHRRMILGRDQTSVLCRPPGHLALMIADAEEQGQSLGIATVMGVHPALTIASQVKAPMGVDEMEIAGAIRGRPLELVRCETIDVCVPADAEMVIEGVLIPGERVADGPFGEFPGDYISLSSFISPTENPTPQAPVVKVTAITMRRNAIFHAMLTGLPVTENQCLSKWAIGASIYRTVAQLVPYPEDIRGIRMTTGGTGHHHVVISVRKRTEAIPRNIIYSVLSRHLFVGLVIVVDEDVNVHDSMDVEWALSSTRVRPDRDIIILPTVDLSEGTSTSVTHAYKWGIDATAPRAKVPWLYKKAVPPGVDKVDYV